MPERTLIQVILPLRLEWEPCYWAPDNVREGDRVAVVFARKQYVAVVHRLGVEAGLDLSKVQPVLDVDTGLPPVSPRELALWEFIASYYLCSIGEVYYAAYPHNKIKSEKVAAKAAQAADRRHALEMDSLAARLERMKARLAAKEETILRRKSSGRASAEVTARLEEERDTLLSQVVTLKDHISRIAGSLEEAQGVPELPEVASGGPRPALLQSSSRAQSYLDAIAGTLAQGRQVLVLTPDVLYCHSLSAALSAGSSGLLEFTSKETPVHRRRISDAVRNGTASVVVGTRSALFLPFRDLGLIIVDEEQDTFYKQDEPAPRYGCRDCAVKLARIHGAEIILGSACPSLETLLNAQSGRYGVLPGSGPVPIAAEVVDMSAERRKRGVYGLFSFKLVEAVRRCEGPVVLIRGWERTEDLQQQIAELFPGRDVRVMRWLEAREADLSEAAVVGILQADALVDKDDFRADERGAQIVAQLSSRCRHLVVQTNVTSRFDGSRTVQDLLDERRDFGFPPYTRVVDLRRRGTGEVIQRFFLKKDSSLAARKAGILASAPKDSFIDVDPL